jgi:transcriptional regulator with XRE-family HTH domain
MKNNGNLFAKRLRLLREKNKLTQKDMAEYLNMPNNTYNGLEMGNRVKLPDAETLNAIADRLDCSVDYLLGRVKHADEAILEDLPEELRVEGVKAVLAVKEALKTGLSAEEINEILEFARRVKRK